ncbi:hypothetical protein ONZ45_g7012 [Pleurotus djamor]|nr:hypothetical protein ONZ45_g7012 [Pleurotus djamor]
MSIKPAQFTRKQLSHVRPQYLSSRVAPTEYNAALKGAAEGYEQARRMIGFLYDITDFESSVPIPFTLAQKTDKYQWERTDEYPPHLLLVPDDVAVGAGSIFSKARLAQTLLIVSNFLNYNNNTKLAPSENEDTFAKLTSWNQERHKDQGWIIKDMYNEPNIGLRNDWFHDAVFAQQFFTGPNPTTITLATSDWIDAFKTAATAQQNDDVVKLLESTTSFYVQDFSYIRESMGAKPSEVLYNDSEGIERYGCAPVALFLLGDDGKLHPVAIIIDYKGSMDASITIFNKRLDPNETSHDQSSDWPWRYAKMCVLSADWALHEMIIHLTHTHLVEEAVIVASHRTLSPTHIVFRLLSPHWAITLSLNELARQVLVPEVIIPISGLQSPHITQFVRNEFTNFDWKGKYIPNDLQNRGFPIDQLNDKKFHNYAYARDMIEMWNTLRSFVKAVLSQEEYYPDDAKVAADGQIQALCAEMRSVTGAGMTKFPESIQTLDELIDLVTMAIHIASSQHTAVNYLQQYYQTFVPNKPSALFSPLPASLGELQSYQETQVIAALPLGRNRQWLLSAQIPYLLSMTVEADQNIVTYAKDASKDGEYPIIAIAAKQLSSDLDRLDRIFKANSLELDDQNTPYDVLAPATTASSIEMSFANLIFASTQSDQVDRPVVARNIALHPHVSTPILRTYRRTLVLLLSMSDIIDFIFLLPEGEKFDGIGPFAPFKRTIENVAACWGLTGYLDGTISKPDSPKRLSLTPTPCYGMYPSLEEWAYRDARLKATISMNTIGIDCLVDDLETKSCAQVWSELKAQFFHHDELYKQHTDNNLRACQYTSKSGQLIAEFFQELRKKRKEAIQAGNRYTDANFRSIIINALSGEEFSMMIQSLRDVTTAIEVMRSITTFCEGREKRQNARRQASHVLTLESTTSTVQALQARIARLETEHNRHERFCRARGY